MTAQISDKDVKPVIGFTCGDLNGIGLEVILKALHDTRIPTMCTPVIYASSKAVSHWRKILNLGDFNYNTIKSIQQHIDKKINLINCWEEDVKIEPGLVNAQGSKSALQSLEMAANDLASGHLHALITAPINKDGLKKEGFSFPGHTEFFAKKAQTKDYLMLMCSEGLRVAVVTGHISLKEVSAQLSPEKIHRKIKSLADTLTKDFGINKPKIAVLGLNPHAGENGQLGTEEKDLIKPAIDKAMEEGIMAFGPYPADGFFGAGTYKQFDATLAMYHDQGLTPFKSIAFETGVNYTAGLPFIRTSPDHGTGFDIAGKGLANEQSIRSALYLCLDIIEARKLDTLITSDPLPFNLAKLGRDQ